MVLLIVVGLSLLYLTALTLLFEAVIRGNPNCLLVFLFFVPVVVKLLVLVRLDLLCILGRLLLDSTLLLLT